jgi:AcrR family transcriptional regulator
MIKNTFTQRGIATADLGESRPDWPKRLRDHSSKTCLSFSRQYVTSNSNCKPRGRSYPRRMPRLWTDTVESHRQEVREAILDAAGELVASRGLLAVSMSQLAETAGIGRATLYKYFADVEQVLTAWHARQVAGHLAQLTALAEGPGEPAIRLRSALEAYGRICRQRARHGGDAMTAALHHSRKVQQSERQLRDLLASLVAEAVAAAVVRSDVPARELASFCVHALTAGADIKSAPAVETLVDLVWAGLSPASSP